MAPHSDEVGVLIVDDQAPFRAAARAVVAATPGFGAVGEAASGTEGVEMVERLRPGMVLMDINMPGIDGLEATRRILAAHPATVVVLVSTYTVDDVPGDVEGSGARAYVNKEDLDPSVLRQVWETHGGPGRASSHGTRAG